jgi:DNA-3-methyladenine glycosylase II
MQASDIKALQGLDPRFSTMLSGLPQLIFRHREAGFSGLSRLIIEQQLSVKAADTIRGRLIAGLGELTPEGIIKADVESLRSFGLSRPKISYLKNLAQAVINGDLDFQAVKGLDSEAAVLGLMQQKGIGRWSAEVYLMFCEGRIDFFPVGDVALREALGWLEGLHARPDEKTAETMTHKWRPYRSVAAHALWHWYGAVKRGEAAKAIF